MARAGPERVHRRAAHCTFRSRASLASYAGRRLHAVGSTRPTRGGRDAMTRTSAIQRKERQAMLAATPPGTTISGQERYLIAYFALVLASAGIAVLVLLAFPGVLPTLPILLLAFWMPNQVGISVTASAGGRPALRELFGRAVRWRF